MLCSLSPQKKQIYEESSEFFAAASGMSPPCPRAYTAPKMQFGSSIRFFVPPKSTNWCHPTTHTSKGHKIVSNAYRSHSINMQVGQLQVQQQQAEPSPSHGMLREKHLLVLCSAPVLVKTLEELLIDLRIVLKLRGIQNFQIGSV